MAVKTAEISHFRKVRQPTAAAEGPLRALDRLSDAQVMAAELLVYLGLPEFRIAERMGIEPATVRRWIRDPLFVAGCNELTRGYAAAQLVPLGLYRIRAMLGDPFTRPADVLKAARFVADLAGMTGRQYAPEAGFFAPASILPGKPLAEMTREELHKLMLQGQRAQDRLVNDLEQDNASPNADISE